MGPIAVSYTHLKGTMNVMITRIEDFDLEEILPKLKAYSPTGVVMATKMCIRDS